MNNKYVCWLLDGEQCRRCGHWLDGACRISGLILKTTWDDIREMRDEQWWDKYACDTLREIVDSAPPRPSQGNEVVVRYLKTAADNGDVATVYEHTEDLGVIPVVSGWLFVDEDKVLIIEGSRKEPMLFAIGDLESITVFAAPDARSPVVGIFLGPDARNILEEEV